MNLAIVAIVDLMEVQEYKVFQDILVIQAPERLVIVVSAEVAHLDILVFRAFQAIQVSVAILVSVDLEFQATLASAEKEPPDTQDIQDKMVKQLHLDILVTVVFQAILVSVDTLASVEI